MANLIEASQSKGAVQSTGIGQPLSRDVQYDAVVKQVNRIRTEKVKAEANEKLTKVYGMPQI